MGHVFNDPTSYEDWVVPHSYQWYSQLGSLTGKYTYSWNATITGEDAEALFDEAVGQLVPGKRVLDIGCGHGEFTLRWSPVVEEIVGLDITADFIETANRLEYANVSFVKGNTKQRLPFEPGRFDCAYNRKGPTSAYADLPRILPKGGQLIALHPGDRSSPELSHLFPGLFSPQPEGTPVWDKIIKNLESGGFTNYQMDTLTTTQYSHEPIDVIRLRCFGQTSSVYERVVQESLPEIGRIFEQNRTGQGLPTTIEHYMVRGVV